MSVVRILVNPKAGRGRGQRALESIRAFAAQQPGDWQVWTTDARGHATELAQRAISEGGELVAAAGGDGTVHEALAGVLGSSAALAVLPVGTGNDLARMLPFGNDLPAALAALAAGSASPVDVGIANGRPFLNVAGCGFDARVAHRINHGLRFLKGTPAYMAAILAELATYRAASLRIETDSGTIETRAMLCALANSRSYGGGLQIAPSAVLDDGSLDLAVIHEIGKLDFVRTLPKAFSGRHTSHPKYHTRRVLRASIASDSPLPVLVDGELAGTTPLHVEIRPAAIRLVR